MAGEVGERRIQALELGNNGAPPGGEGFGGFCLLQGGAKEKESEPKVFWFFHHWRRSLLLVERKSLPGDWVHRNQRSNKREMRQEKPTRSVSSVKGSRRTSSEEKG